MVPSDTLHRRTRHIASYGSIENLILYKNTCNVHSKDLYRKEIRICFNLRIINTSRQKRHVCCLSYKSFTPKFCFRHGVVSNSGLCVTKRGLLVGVTRPSILFTSSSGTTLTRPVLITTALRVQTKS